MTTLQQILVNIKQAPLRQKDLLLLETKNRLQNSEENHVLHKVRQVQIQENIHTLKEKIANSSEKLIEFSQEISSLENEIKQTEESLLDAEKFKELSPQFISELIDNQAIRLSASAKNFDGMSAGTRTAVMD